MTRRRRRPGLSYALCERVPCPDCEREPLAGCPTCKGRMTVSAAERAVIEILERQLVAANPNAPLSRERRRRFDDRTWVREREQKAIDARRRH